jgi:hypothetical protein
MLPSLSTAGPRSGTRGAIALYAAVALLGFSCVQWAQTQGGPPPLGVASHTRPQQRVSARGGRWGDEKGEYNG